MKLTEQARAAIARDQENLEKIYRRNGWIKPDQRVMFQNRYRCARTGDVQKSEPFTSLFDAIVSRVPDCGGYFFEGTIWIMREFGR